MEFDTTSQYPSARRYSLSGAILLVSVLCGLTYSTLAADLSIRSFLDRTVVGVGDRFTLSVELSGPDGDSAPPPELPSLEPFAQYLGSGSSQSVQIVNGRMSSSKTLNYYFLALSEGRHEIGPVIVNYQGQQFHTDPIFIEIGARQTAQPQQSRPDTGGLSPSDLFIRAVASKDWVYQNEPIILTYKIYTRVSISQYGISSLPDWTGFWAENLLDEKRQVETVSEVVNGQAYTVATLQKMALFPTGPGKKRLEPLEVECEVRVRSPRRSLFDDFFNDPFGGSPFGSTLRQIVRSQPMEIEVRPLPKEGRPADFSGAVGQFRLSGSLDKTQVSANDVVTLRLKVEGTGNIRTLPPLKIQTTPGLEAYEPEVKEVIEPRANSVQGERSYEYVLVARLPGEQRVDVLRLPYFDPVGGEYKIASLDELVLQVSKGTAMHETDSPPLLPKQDVLLKAQEIRFIKLETPDFSDSGRSPDRNALLWVLLVSPLALLGGAQLYRRHLDRLAGDQAYARSRRADSLARKRMSGARDFLTSDSHHEFYFEVGKALRSYVADKFNLIETGLTSDHLEAALFKQGVSPEAVRNFQSCLATCDEKRFSPTGSELSERKEFLGRAEAALKQVHMELS